MPPQDAALVHIGDVSLWILATDYQLPRFVHGQATVPDLAPIDTVFQHYWKFGLEEFAFLDVGAKYGLGTILAANFMNSLSRRNSIVCFEPGAAASLIGRNLEMNGMDRRVTLEIQAVSDRCGETILYGDPAHPEDNHIIQRNVSQPLKTKVVQTVTLDAYLDTRGICSPLVVKVDTQGAEWEVWRGMQRASASFPVTIMTEFTPWTFSGRAEPAAFLREVSEQYDIIHLHPKNLAGAFHEAEAPFRRVPPGSFEEFTSTIAGSAGGWTDLLCIPRKLPGCGGLVDAVLAAG